MSTREPGTVAVATVRGVPNVRVVRVDYPTTPEWMSFAQVCGALWHSEQAVNDVRPLVVLDLYNDLTTQDVCRVLDEGGYGNVSEQIEAQTKPPRIPEPGLYRVVEAGPRHDRKKWVRGPKGWTMVDATGTYLNWNHWDNLIEPTLFEGS